MQGIKIERVVAADCEALSDLAFRSKASNGYDDEFMAACRDELTLTAEKLERVELWKVAVLEHPGLLGMFGLRQNGDGLYVTDFFVASEFKRRGIGVQMWQAIERRAEQIGARKLCLDADPAAVVFYEAMGLRTVGESPSGSIAGRMLPRMEKLLPLVFVCRRGVL